MASKILITGGTGLVGTKLTNALRTRGDEIRILTTSAIRAEQPDAFYWNLKDQYIDYRAFEGVDYIIHLAGAGVADKPWSEKRKKLIYDSRIKNTNLLFERLKGSKVKGVIAASAIGYYGMDTGEKWLNEADARGTDFLSDVVADWEEAIFSLNERAERVTALRIGIVLSTDGGALKKMAPPFRYGLGAPIGTGKQWMSWIHEDDLVGMILFALDKELEGVYNAVAPHPVTNAEFSRVLAKTLGKPFFLPNVPAFALKLVFGEMARVVLGGNRVKADKIKKAGYPFKFNKIDEALRDLLK